MCDETKSRHKDNGRQSREGDEETMSRERAGRTLRGDVIPSLRLLLSTRGARHSIVPIPPKSRATRHMVFVIALLSLWSNQASLARSEMVVRGGLGALHETTRRRW